MDSPILKPSPGIVPLARFLLSLIFLVSGVTKIVEWNTYLGYMDAKAMPLVPLFLFLSFTLELIGGICLLIGFRTPIVATALAFYLIPVTLIFHNFWDYQGIMRQVQITNMLKNISIIGGLLLLSYFGAGPYSMDNSSNSRES